LMPAKSGEEGLRSTTGRATFAVGCAAHEPRMCSRIGQSRSRHVSSGEDPGGRRVDPG
jgi:hypothetical protein